MKASKIILLVSAFFLAASVGAFVLSNPALGTRVIKSDGCSAEYTFYLIPTCREVWDGHSWCSAWDKSNAEKEVFHCLCSKYLSRGETGIEQSLRSYCKKLDCEEKYQETVHRCSQIPSCSMLPDPDPGFLYNLDYVCNNKESFYQITMIH
jgi:hypothetical protein